MTSFPLAGEGSLCVRLAARERIAEPVALVVAHPDDETLGLGSRLHLFDRLTLIHLTDGAPADMGDARRAGFATRDAYAAARAAELAAALEVLGARPVRALAYGVLDQAVVEHLPELARRLASDLADQAAVVTHAYEGGHPDHDACALAVARARKALRPDAPAAYEFAGYFGVDGVLHGNAFHPDPRASGDRLGARPRRARPQGARLRRPRQPAPDPGQLPARPRGPARRARLRLHPASAPRRGALRPLRLAADERGVAGARRARVVLAHRPCRVAMGRWRRSARER